MATLGVRVTLVEGRSNVLGFLDQEITDAFQYFMRQKGITLRLGEKVESIAEVQSEASGTKQTLVEAQLESGKTLRAEALLYAVGRQGVCGALGLDKVGIEFDDRERLNVNEHYQTNVPHVYAAGDVIGFPALASTSMEQGRRAVCHAFGVCDVRNYNTELFPYGIYAVPEISMVGKTEEQLTERGDPLRGGHRPLPRDRPRPAPGRRAGHAQDADPPGDAQAAGRPHHRRRRHRADPHRPGGDGARTARPSSSSTTSSTSRRSPSATRWPPTTG